MEGVYDIRPGEEIRVLRFPHVLRIFLCYKMLSYGGNVRDKIKRQLKVLRLAILGKRLGERLLRDMRGELIGGVFDDTFGIQSISGLHSLR